MTSMNEVLDSPVAIEWSSAKVKILGVFLGPFVSEEDNWRPRITAVENVMSSWRQRSSSYRGKALVINALALSRIWYVASVIHMPQWVLRELNKLVFNFFWKGKPDLVTRDVIAQPPSSGGFSVINIQLKVWVLLLQWVKRFSLSLSTWVSFFLFWCGQGFAASPVQVLSTPSRFYGSGGLPVFYLSLLSAWRSIDGSFLPSRGSLCVGRGLMVSPVSSLTSKSAYLMLVSELPGVPHCVGKFLPSFGTLYWPSTWRKLFFFHMDWQVIDLSWKVAHGVLYTADRLSSFGYAIPTACFCGHALESLDHLFFSCPLAVSVLSWLSSLLFLSSPLVLSFFAMSVLDSRKMSCCASLGFLFMLSMCVSSLFGWLGMTFASMMCSLELLLFWKVLSPGFGFICHCFSAFSNPLGGAGILVGSGVPMVLLVQSVMAVCFYRFSSYSFTFFSFSFCLFPTFVCFWLLAPSLAAWPFCSIR